MPQVTVLLRTLDAGEEFADLLERVRGLGELLAGEELHRAAVRRVAVLLVRRELGAEGVLDLLVGRDVSRVLGGVADRAPGEAIRLALLNAHYRQPLDWSDQILTETKRKLDRLYGTLRDIDGWQSIWQTT